MQSDTTNSPNETKASDNPSQHTQPNRMKARNFLKDWREEKWGNRLTIIFSSVLTCFTIVLAIYTIKLVRESSKQTKISNSALKLARYSDSVSNVLSAESIKRSDSSISLTNKSLLLTKESMDLGDSNFEIQNRAYLSLNGVEMDTSNDIVVVSVGIINNGKTPAFKALSLAGTYVANSEIWINNVDKIYKFPVSDFVVIGANEPSTMTTKFKRATLRAIIASNGKSTLYLFSKITYEDIFYKKHFVHIFLRYIPTEGNWTTCNQYNEEDR
jgi:hypothetical protein